MCVLFFIFYYAIWVLSHYLGSLFWKVPKSIDDKGSWASRDGWLDWVWFSAGYWGHYMNQFVCKSHKAPQGKNAIPPKQ